MSPNLQVTSSPTASTNNTVKLLHMGSTACLVFHQITQRRRAFFFLLVASMKPCHFPQPPLSAHSPIVAIPFASADIGNPTRNPPLGPLLQSTIGPIAAIHHLAHCCDPP